MTKKRRYWTSLILIAIACPGGLTAREWQVPENAPTIQAAIDQADPGDLILVAPGTYGERIRLKPRITLRSQGDDTAGKTGLKRAEATIIDGGGESGGEAPGVIMAEGAILDGFTVTNVGTYDEAKWQQAWDVKGANQSHEHIGHFGTPGIAVTGVTCSILNNIVHHISATGIAIQGEKGKRCAPLVSGNVCYRNMGGGIGSMKGSTAIIDGNTCYENFYAGIGHDNASPLVTNNDCYKNVRAGIGVSEGSCAIVRGNRCYQNRRAGIGIRTGETTRPIIEDNDCYENEMAGIGVEEEAAPIIRNNRCHHNLLAGIGCQEHANPIIDGNHCYENKAAGIGTESASALIRGNRCEKNATTGIGINGSSTALVIGNTCEENRLVAIGIPNGGQALLHGNTFVRTGGGMPPIVAILNGANATLIDNTIRGGGVGAIMLDGELTAIGNTIVGQDGGSGIVIREKGHATLSGNTITGYKKPVNDPTKATMVGD
ncbi:MAG: right-handed parallel beta-helix repeat-containing protein [Verrucomicrobiae bacterium]|nr:right-handed parallel beta-helix repeat-containing protein [Verrucomicrobiae bacterium]